MAKGEKRSAVPASARRVLHRSPQERGVEHWVPAGGYRLEVAMSGSGYQSAHQYFGSLKKMKEDAEELRRVLPQGLLHRVLHSRGWQLGYAERDYPGRAFWHRRTWLGDEYITTWRDGAWLHEPTLVGHSPDRQPRKVQYYRSRYVAQGRGFHQLLQHLVAHDRMASPTEAVLSGGEVEQVLEAAVRVRTQGVVARRLRLGVHSQPGLGGSAHHGARPTGYKVPGAQIHRVRVKARRFPRPQARSGRGTRARLWYADRLV